MDQKSSFFSKFENYYNELMKLLNQNQLDKIIEEIEDKRNFYSNQSLNWIITDIQLTSLIKKVKIEIKSLKYSVIHEKSHEFKSNPYILHKINNINESIKKIRNIILDWKKDFLSRKINTLNSNTILNSLIHSTNENYESYSYLISFRLNMNYQKERIFFYSTKVLLLQTYLSKILFKEKEAYYLLTIILKFIIDYASNLIAVKNIYKSKHGSATSTISNDNTSINLYAYSEIYENLRTLFEKTPFSDYSYSVITEVFILLSNHFIRQKSLYMGYLFIDLSLKIECKEITYIYNKNMSNYNYNTPYSILNIYNYIGSYSDFLSNAVSNHGELLNRLISNTILSSLNRTLVNISVSFLLRGIIYECLSIMNESSKKNSTQKIIESYRQSNWFFKKRSRLSSNKLNMVKLKIDDKEFGLNQKIGKSLSESEFAYQTLLNDIQKKVVFNFFEMFPKRKSKIRIKQEIANITCINQYEKVNTSNENDFFNKDKFEFNQEIKRKINENLKKMIFIEPEEVHYNALNPMNSISIENINSKDLCLSTIKLLNLFLSLKNRSFIRNFFNKIKNPLFFKGNKEVQDLISKEISYNNLIKRKAKRREDLKKKIKKLLNKKRNTGSLIRNRYSVSIKRTCLNMSVDDHVRKDNFSSSGFTNNELNKRYDIVRGNHNKKIMSKKNFYYHNEECYVNNRNSNSNSEKNSIDHIDKSSKILSNIDVSYQERRKRNNLTSNKIVSEFVPSISNQTINKSNNKLKNNAQSSSYRDTNPCTANTKRSINIVNKSNKSSTKIEKNLNFNKKIMVLSTISGFRKESKNNFNIYKKKVIDNETVNIKKTYKKSDFLYRLIKSSEKENNRPNVSDSFDYQGLVLNSNNINEKSIKTSKVIEAKVENIKNSFERLNFYKKYSSKLSYLESYEQREYNFNKHILNLKKKEKFIENEYKTLNEKTKCEIFFNKTLNKCINEYETSDEIQLKSSLLLLNKNIQQKKYIDNLSLTRNYMRKEKFLKDAVINSLDPKAFRQYNDYLNINNTKRNNYVKNYNSSFNNDGNIIKNNNISFEKILNQTTSQIKYYNDKINHIKLKNLK